MLVELTKNTMDGDTRLIAVDASSIKRIEEVETRTGKRFTVLTMGDGPKIWAVEPYGVVVGRYRAAMEMTKATTDPIGFVRITNEDDWYDEIPSSDTGVGALNRAE